jgi:hypothetical protein
MGDNTRPLEDKAFLAPLEQSMGGILKWQKTEVQVRPTNLTCCLQGGGQQIGGCCLPGKRFATKIASSGRTYLRFF